MSSEPRFLVHFLFIFGIIWKLIKCDQMPPSVVKHKGLLLMLTGSQCTLVMTTIKIGTIGDPGGASEHRRN